MMMAWGAYNEIERICGSYNVGITWMRIINWHSGYWVGMNLKTYLN